MVSSMPSCPAVESSSASLAATTCSGRRSRWPMIFTRTRPDLKLGSCNRRALSCTNKSSRHSTSAAGRLKFSVLKTYRVTWRTSRSMHHSSTSRSLFTPYWWPSVASSPMPRAKRRLPSRIRPMCAGTGPLATCRARAWAYQRYNGCSNGFKIRHGRRRRSVSARRSQPGADTAASLPASGRESSVCMDGHCMPVGAAPLHRRILPIHTERSRMLLATIDPSAPHRKSRMNGFAWLPWRRPPPPIDDVLWRDALAACPLARRLPPDDLQHLRELAARFLQRKRFHPIDMELDARQRLLIAMLACLPVLRLGFRALRGWQGVVVYPGEFRVRHRHHDGSTGVVIESDQIRIGEAWQIGPLVLSWAAVEHDLAQPWTGSNVVVHEIAHKLDMLDGP